MKVVVLLPTYNEAETIAQTIKNIRRFCPASHILVIDDSSPDGTARKSKELINSFGPLTVIEREGLRGRGIAGAYGFKKALEMGADLIVEMDADMSHHPKHIPLLIEAATEYDVVIGSRFVKGGREIGRPFTRKLISRVANIYIRILLGFSIRDWTHGFRCYRRKTLEYIDPEKIVSIGPSIVEETLFKIKRAKFKIKEVPVVYFEREKGKSKLSFKILLKTLVFPWRLLFSLC